MLSLLAALLLTAGPAAERQDDAADAAVPASIQRKLHQLAAPGSDVEQLASALLDEMRELPPEQRERARDLFAASLEARLAPERHPRVFADIGPLWGFPETVLGSLDDLLTKEDPINWHALPKPVLESLLEDVEKLEPGRRQFLREHLSNALPKLNPIPRMKLTLLLAKMGDPSGLGLAIAELRSSDDRRRRLDAAMVLGFSGHGKAVDPLRSATRDRAPEIRCAALGFLPDLDALQALAEARRHLEDLEVVTWPEGYVTSDLAPATVASCALHALGKVGDVEVAPELLKALGDPRLKGAACGGLLALRKRLAASAPQDCDGRRWAEWLGAQRGGPVRDR